MEYHFVATVLVEMGLQGILDLDSLRKGIDGGHRYHVIVVGEGIVKGIGAVPKSKISVPFSKA